MFILVTTYQRRWRLTNETLALIDGSASAWSSFGWRHLCNVQRRDDFLKFFDQKVKTVRTATEGRPPSPSTTVTANVSLSMLSPCSEDEVRRLILQSPTKSCALDPIPTFVLKELVDVLMPYVTAMINASLCAGRLPPSQKHAVVTPLLKKTGMDAEEQKNYRPVSNLTFLSKLTTYLSVNTVWCRSYSRLIDVTTAQRRHYSKCCRTSMLPLTVSKWPSSAYLIWVRRLIA